MVVIGVRRSGSTLGDAPQLTSVQGSGAVTAETGSAVADQANSGVVIGSLRKHDVDGSENVI